MDIGPRGSPALALAAAFLNAALGLCLVCQAHLFIQRNPEVRLSA